MVDLGLMEYRACAELQQQTAEEVVSGASDCLLIVQHPPVLTLGANFHAENLLFPESEYRKRGIAVEKTERGGDVTFHGPGQLVAYPIFNLKNHGQDLHKWLRQLEETLIHCVAKFDLIGERFAPNTGVWVGGRKVAAIGVRVSRWVSTHGIALNCDNDLSPFGLIVPCGIRSHGVTSLSELTGRNVGVSEAVQPLVSSFEEVFGIRLEPSSLKRLTEEQIIHETSAEA